MEGNNIIELVKDSLFITFSSKSEFSHPQYVSFYPDRALIYTAFFADFGPLDLGLTCKFCHQLEEKMKLKRQILFVASDHPQLRANSAVLICAFMIFVLNFSVEKAYAPFIGIEPPFHTFRDAGFCINTFPITVLDCARAMSKAKTLGHFHFNSFVPNHFHNLAKLQNGDISWIIPNKFIAFSGPIAKRRQISPGVTSLLPEEYVPLMKSLGVSCIVRFNSKCYDRNVFVANGIRHVDLFYEDGGNPTDAILQAFLSLSETERGAIAVHCKAGLGRTGTNIAAYMIKHFGYSTKESIAWCSIEGKMIQEGIQYNKNKLSLPKADKNNNPLISNIMMNTNKINNAVSLHQSLQIGSINSSSNNNNNNNNNRPSTSGGPPTSPPSSSSFSMRIRRDVSAKRGVFTGGNNNNNTDNINTNMSNLRNVNTSVNNNNNAVTTKLDFSTGTIIRKNQSRGSDNRPRTSYGYGK